MIKKINRNDDGTRIRTKVTRTHTHRNKRYFDVFASMISSRRKEINIDERGRLCCWRTTNKKRCAYCHNEWWRFIFTFQSFSILLIGLRFADLMCVWSRERTNAAAAAQMIAVGGNDGGGSAGGSINRATTTTKKIAFIFMVEKTMTALSHTCVECMHIL